jgi:hypothetical protein
MRKINLLFTAFLFAVVLFSVNIQAAPLRRPISPTSPTWVIHIDVWAKADPQKVIDIVPADIRPYVIFNVALSVSDPGSGPYGKNVNTISIAESWVRTCAEAGVWVTIQPASGYKNNLPYTHGSNDIYEHFYKEYPNFLGYNFAEQCWGFPSDADFDTRLALFSQLIRLGNKYGGYLFVSHTQTINAPQNNAIASLKRSNRLRSDAKNYKENYIVLEKHTTSRGFYDVESTCLGTYLAGYCGNYGIRFDNCGWTYIPAREKKPFPETLGIIPIVEHGILTGQTVSDGPELTWQIAVLGNGTQTSADGYTSKSFRTHNNFTNNNLDVFRKFIDGSFPIPSKEQIIEQTKIAYVNNATTGSNANKYSSEQSLFTDLYALDGEYSKNNIWTKKTGRYPTIPTIFQAGDYETGAFDVVVSKSQYASRWNNIQAKVNEFNTLFPEEYTGSIYARRIDNIWVTYNPYMGVVTFNPPVDTTFYQENSPASGSIPFKYNTCEKIEISHPNYSMAVITEYSDKLDIYLNNFCSTLTDGISLLREDTIKIYGSASKPDYTYTNRGGNGAGTITIVDSWANNVYTLRVKHNGPLDLTINCAGNATGRIAQIPVTPLMIQPPAPPVYRGPRQYEFEDFEYKSISAPVQTTAIGYQAMGYSSFGGNSSAAMRKKVNINSAGSYKLTTRYSSPARNVTTIDLYVNGVKVVTPVFTQTGAIDTDIAWNENIQNINLNAGDNTILFKANASSQGTLFYLDNIVIESNETSGIQEIPDNGATIISTEYFNLFGQRILPERNNSKGIFIESNLMSDGKTISKKIIII